jgi:hypothetical protein
MFLRLEYTALGLTLACDFDFHTAVTECGYNVMRDATGALRTVEKCPRRGWKCKAAA